MFLSVGGALAQTAADGDTIKLKGATWRLWGIDAPILKPQIGKLPTGIDLSQSVENEHFCMRLVEAFGLTVALAPMPIAAQFQHVGWNMAISGGLHFWDLIQPFFMFIVGAVMPISFARRWAAGETWSRSLLHVLRRSALLIAFGLIARSVQANKPVIDLINVLAQIAFTYLVAFLVLRKSWKIQGGVALGLHTVGQSLAGCQE